MFFFRSINRFTHLLLLSMSKLHQGMPIGNPPDRRKLLLQLHFSPDKYCGQPYLTDADGIDYIELERFCYHFVHYLSSDGWLWILDTRTLTLRLASTYINDSPGFHWHRKGKAYVRVRHRRRWVLIHRLMAQYFLNGGEPLPAGLQVDHLNSDVHDNAVTNLEIVTAEENYRRRNALHHYKRMSAHTRQKSRERQRLLRARRTKNS